MYISGKDEVKTLSNYLLFGDDYLVKLVWKELTETRFENITSAANGAVVPSTSRHQSITLSELFTIATVFLSFYC